MVIGATGARPCGSMEDMGKYQQMGVVNMRGENVNIFRGKWA